MDARFYNSEDIDIERLATDLEQKYRIQGYEVQQIGNKDQMMVQLKKGGDLAALVGMQTALSVIIQHMSGGTTAMIGQQRWIDKAAVGAVGLVAAPVLWPLMLTAGAGAIRQASLGNQVRSFNADAPNVSDAVSWPGQRRSALGRGVDVDNLVGNGGRLRRVSGFGGSGVAVHRVSNCDESR